TRVRPQNVPNSRSDLGRERLIDPQHAIVDETSHLSCRKRHESKMGDPARSSKVALASPKSGVNWFHHRLRAEHLLMKEDHREKAAMALARFRKEVREAGFSEDELGDILGHISALEQEVKAPKPDTAIMKSSTEALDEVTHSPDVTDAIARVVRFFNSIGIQ
ncbi:MAG: hypothetical protein ACREEV_03635, partial [Dongiaceae bacterium]